MHPILIYNIYRIILFGISIYRLIYPDLDLQLNTMIVSRLHNIYQYTTSEISITILRNIVLSIIIYVISIAVCDFIIYINSFKKTKELETCAICLEDYTDYIFEPRTKLLCGHQYHKKCIDQWLITNASCPYCRYRLD